MKIIFSDTEAWVLSTFDGTTFTDDPSMLERHPKSFTTFAILCEQGGSIFMTCIVFVFIISILSTPVLNFPTI